MRYKSLCTFLLSICVSVVHSSISNDVTKNMEVTYEDVGPRIGNKLIRSSRSKRPFRNQEEDEDKLSEQEIISKVLDGYDWRVRPRGLNATWKDTGGPVNVTVNIFLRSISKVDDVNMEYSAQFTFREQWRDPRLGFSRLSVQKENLPPFVVLATSEQGTDQQIWMPDTFFQNEKEARRHLIDKPNVLIRIYPDGGILYSVSVAACCRGLEDDLAFQVNPDTFMSNELTVLPIGSPNVPYRPGELLSLVLSCPMSLEYYPLDHQTCIIELASYAYTTADIVYFWKFTEPIQFKDGLRKSLPSFELQDVKTDYCTSKTNTGEYSCLRTKLILRREFSYYLLQLYIPSFMLVIVSWVSFWLDKDSVPARVTLGVTTLLTMTTQSSGINAKLPPVSYTKAIDVWIGVCLAFIFGALLEFALVNYAARKDMMIESRGRGMRRGGGNRQRSLILPPSEDPNEQVNSLAMSPLLQKPLRPELIPANYHPALYQTGPGFPNHTLPSPLPNIPSHSNRPKSRRHAHGCMMAFFREYSCLRTKLILKREYSYYLLQLYIPSFMLVIVSWVSFWLDKDAVPARVSLGVTTLLTMTTQASGINAKLPPVSYTKAVDVWIGACMGFIFGALLEFALVNYAGRMEFMEKEKQSKRRPTNHSSMMMHDPMSSGIGMPSMPPPTINFPPQNTAIPIPESAGQKFGPLIETTGCPECEAESHIHSSEYFDPNLAMAEKKISPPGDIRLQQDPFYDQMRPLVASPMDFQMSSMKIKKKRKSTRSGCCFCMNEFLRKYWYTEKSKRIDIFSRVVFPLGFFFFNGVYWAIYLSPQS